MQIYDRISIILSMVSTAYEYAKEPRTIYMLEKIMEELEQIR